MDTDLLVQRAILKYYRLGEWYYLYFDHKYQWGQIVAAVLVGFGPYSGVQLLAEFDGGDQHSYHNAEIYAADNWGVPPVR